MALGSPAPDLPDLAHLVVVERQTTVGLDLESRRTLRFDQGAARCFRPRRRGRTIPDQTDRNPGAGILRSPHPEGHALPPPDAPGRALCTTPWPAVSPQIPIRIPIRIQTRIRT